MGGRFDLIPVPSYAAFVLMVKYVSLSHFCAFLLFGIEAQKFTINDSVDLVNVMIRRERTL